jgi:hypothetical protein
MNSKSETQSSGTVASTTNPWAPQADALTKAFSDAQAAYGQSSSATAPTDFTAQFTPEQLATFKSMIDQGGDMSTPQNQAAAGQSLTNAGTAGATGALSGYSGFNAVDSNNPQSLVDAANKYADGQDIDSQVKNAMLGATQTARDVTMPGIEQNAALGGNTNSSRTGIADGLVQRGLAEQSANLGASLRSTAFQNGLTLAQTQAQNNNADKLAALQGQGALGTATANSGVAAGSASIDNTAKQDAIAQAGGAGLQAANQADLTNQAQQYASQTSSPYASLQQLMSIIGGQNWGSQTNGTTTGDSTTTKTPSIFDIIGGALGAVGNAVPLFKARRTKWPRRLMSMRAVPWLWHTTLRNLRLVKS